LEEVLSINNLSKRYGSVHALSNFSLSVKKGEVWGILGPNGSGKTTTLSIILGATTQSSGDYQWFGKQVNSEALQKIGALLEHPNFYPYLSAIDNLRIIAQIRKADAEEIKRVLSFVNLYERRNHKYQTYSLGMKQRLALAAAMLGKPEVLILDEPTNGLDPTGIAEIRNLISQLASEGSTVILASHLLDEVQKVCTHVAVLSKGKNLFSGNVNQVLSDEDVIEVGAAGSAALADALIEFPGYKSHRILHNMIEMSLKNHTDTGQLNSYLFAKGIVCTHLFAKKRSLENYYLELINNQSGTQQ
jgi:ABC-2 type transport system ATP-binding protein